MFRFQKGPSVPLPETAGGSARRGGRPRVLVLHAVDEEEGGGDLVGVGKGAHLDVRVDTLPEGSVLLLEAERGQRRDGHPAAEAPDHPWRGP